MTRKEEEGSRVTTPRFPEVPPPDPGMTYSNFILTAIMDLKGTVAQLTQAVETLTKESENQGKLLNSISHRAYAAGVVVTLLVAVVGFFLNKVWDLLVATKLGH